jgi:hypothetical protein
MGDVQKAGAAGPKPAAAKPVLSSVKLPKDYILPGGTRLPEGTRISYFYDGAKLMVKSYVLDGNKTVLPEKGEEAVPASKAASSAPAQKKSGPASASENTDAFIKAANRQIAKNNANAVTNMFQQPLNHRGKEVL